MVSHHAVSVAASAQLLPNIPNLTRHQTSTLNYYQLCHCGGQTQGRLCLSVYRGACRRCTVSKEGIARSLLLLTNLYLLSIKIFCRCIYYSTIDIWHQMSTNASGSPTSYPSIGGGGGGHVGDVCCIKIASGSNC